MRTWTQLGLGIITCMTLAFPLHATITTKEVADPLAIPYEQEVSIDLVEKTLQADNEVERHLGLSSLIKTFGPWITLQYNEQKMRIHIITYLLQKNLQQDAVSLIKSKEVPGWLSYRFQNGVANDFLFALDAGRIDYVLGLIEYAPEGVNSTFPVTLDGDLISPLSLLATDKYRKLPQYEVVLRALLKAGANPFAELPNGLSPMVISASTNNLAFSRIVNAFEAEKKGDGNDLFKNTPLSEDEVLEMQAIADALIERQASQEDNYDFKSLHQLWIKMIIKGYNVPADIIYDKLISYKDFSIDYRSGEKGLTALMASTLSNLYGGNVEYAKRLIARGADPKALIDVSGDGATKATRINLIQLALQNDNYKVVALLIQNGVNFVLLPDDEDTLILSEAMQQRAFKSAYVIKEAINSSFSKLNAAQ